MMDVSSGTTAATYWSATYRGPEIAAHRHVSGWLVYIDRIMQENTLFDSADDAAVWLHRKIDNVLLQARL
jgi:hypothetical protein